MEMDYFNPTQTFYDLFYQIWVEFLFQKGAQFSLK